MLTLRNKIELLKMLKTNWDLYGAEPIDLNLERIYYLLDKYKVNPTLYPHHSGDVIALWEGKKDLKIIFSKYFLDESEVLYECKRREIIINGVCSINKLDKLINWVTR